MFYYLDGKVAVKDPTFVVIDVNGVGYKVHISLKTFDKIGNAPNIRLFIYNHIKEDMFTLFGFYEKAEQDIFEHLVSVSGIGTNTARLVLSSMEHSEVRTAILTDNVPAFGSIKGIGPKTAKRIILDLKDKMHKAGDDPILQSVSVKNEVLEEASKALIALGFPKNAVHKTLKNILQNEENQQIDVEKLIKLALKQFT